MVIIEGKHITDKETLWKELHQKMEFPEYFGNNLDALADVLSEKKEKIEVKILDVQEIEENLGGYGKSFLRILEEFCVLKF